LKLKFSPSNRKVGCCWHVNASHCGLEETNNRPVVCGWVDGAHSPGFPHPTPSWMVLVTSRSEMYKELQCRGEGQASEIAQLVRQWADRGNMIGREGRVSRETASSSNLAGAQISLFFFLITAAQHPTPRLDAAGLPAGWMQALYPYQHTSNRCLDVRCSGG
jgi:hypothetical protein